MTSGNAGKNTSSTTEKPYKLLVADDQPQILEALRLLLKPEGYVLEMVRTPALLLDALSNDSFDGVLVDLNYTRDTTSGQEGMDLVARIKEIDSQLPVIVMTAWGNIDLAVEAMRRGASDFIQKPWENARLPQRPARRRLSSTAASKRTQWLEAENRILRAPGAPDFIASAPSMRPVLETHGARRPLRRERAHHRRAWHRQRSGRANPAPPLLARADRTLVAVNTGALPEGTFESELFGHVKGAFTDARTDRIGRFELANGGTTLPRRNRQHPCSPAGQTSSRSGDRRTGTRRLLPNAIRRRARALRHQRQSSSRLCRRPLPRRPVSSG